MRLKIVILFVIGLLALPGCSFLNREYSVIEEHRSSYYETEDESVLRAENYQDLVNDVLLLVSDHLEEGTIWLYSSDVKLDAEQAIGKACQEVQRDTPVGSYAVDYMTYAVDEEGGSYSAINVSIGYRRTKEQVNRIIHTTNSAALYSLLTTAVENGDKELVIHLGYFNQKKDEIEEVVLQVEEEQQLQHGQLEVHYYPEEGPAEIIEICFIDASEIISGDDMYNPGNTQEENNPEEVPIEMIPEIIIEPRNQAIEGNETQPQEWETVHDPQKN